MSLSYRSLPFLILQKSYQSMKFKRFRPIQLDYMLSDSTAHALYFF